jgi:hypothetical protein
MTCACGCGTEAARHFVTGHNLRGMPRTDRHKAAISASMRQAWQTRRKRLEVGTRKQDRDGYVQVKVVPGSGRWKPEHVIVAEEELGRSMFASEEVHHVNGRRDDNRRANLFVCSDKRHHNAVESSLRSVVSELIDAGVIKFDPCGGKGRYHL